MQSVPYISRNSDQAKTAARVLKDIMANLRAKERQEAYKFCSNIDFAELAGSRDILRLEHDLTVDHADLLSDLKWTLEEYFDLREEKVPYEKDCEIEEGLFRERQRFPK